VHCQPQVRGRLGGGLCGGKGPLITMMTVYTGHPCCRPHPGIWGGGTWLRRGWRGGNPLSAGGEVCSQRRLAANYLAGESCLGSIAVLPLPPPPPSPRQIKCFPRYLLSPRMVPCSPCQYIDSFAFSFSLLFALFRFPSTISTSGDSLNSSCLRRGKGKSRFYLFF
jgi:hypothetical protein